MPQTSSSGMFQRQEATAFHSFIVTFISLAVVVEIAVKTVSERSRRCKVGVQEICGSSARIRGDGLRSGVFVLLEKIGDRQSIRDPDSKGATPA